MIPPTVDKIYNELRGEWNFGLLIENKQINDELMKLLEQYLGDYKVGVYNKVDKIDDKRWKVYLRVMSDKDWKEEDNEEEGGKRYTYIILWEFSVCEITFNAEGEPVILNREKLENEARHLKSILDTLPETEDVLRQKIAILCPRAHWKAIIIKEYNDDINSVRGKLLIYTPDYYGGTEAIYNGAYSITGEGRIVWIGTGKLIKTSRFYVWTRKHRDTLGVGFITRPHIPPYRVYKIGQTNYWDVQLGAHLIELLHPNIIYIDDWDYLPTNVWRRYIIWDRAKEEFKMIGYENLIIDNLYADAERNISYIFSAIQRLNYTIEQVIKMLRKRDVSNVINLPIKIWVSDDGETIIINPDKPYYMELSVKEWASKDWETKHMEEIEKYINVVICYEGGNEFWMALEKYKDGGIVKEGLVYGVLIAALRSSGSDMMILRIPPQHADKFPCKKYGVIMLSGLTASQDKIEIIPMIETGGA